MTRKAAEAKGPLETEVTRSILGVTDGLGVCDDVKINRLIF